MHSTPNMFVLNSLRTLTMLEKAIDRLIRQNYFNNSQVPEVIKTLNQTIIDTRMFILGYKAFGNIPAYMNLVASSINELGKMVGELIVLCPCCKGKNGKTKKQKEAMRKRLINSINKMLLKLKTKFPKDPHAKLNDELSKFVILEFEKWCKEYKQKLSHVDILGRGKQTCIYPFSDINLYIDNISNKEWFKKNMMKDLDKFIPESGHGKNCDKANRAYRLRGFRPKNRKVIASGGKKDVRSRMVQCKECDKIFSILPSFVSREKHYSIDIIGKVLEGILLRGVCLQYAQEIVELTGVPLKSKQSVLNWMEWVSVLHPAELLERAGTHTSGYFQEDEGFQKEPNLRTYIVAMVDSKSQVVWHIDYIDRVGEEALYKSFKDFLEKISFKIKGVTKDKWEASTNALKRLFDKLWIGYCHRHCLSNFKKALVKYQKETKISDEKLDELYNSFKKVIEATHKNNLIAKLKGLKDEAFKHPLLKCRLDELEKDAVHYTVNINRSGVKKTTSIVDNFLKIAKRKLREAMSFRDPKWAGIFFRAMANVRNFLPFKSPAKNSHKSPFMLAGGETFSLPWMQVINVYNGFLFDGIRSKDSGRS